MARASAPTVFPWKYDVFLSFRGEDTRRGFTDHLYKQLEARGIKTFRDEPEFERGTDINPKLLRAIDQSMSAIIVLSTNFASSSWCLRELTHIVRCMKEKKRIFPIFYGVDPSDVRHQRGRFGEAFAEHEVNYREHVNEWRRSLKRVADLAGWDSRDCRYDTELIQRIVNTLWEEVHPTLSMLDSSERFVGIDSKLEEIDLLLDTDANDIRFIGIRGMGGVDQLEKLVKQKEWFGFGSRIVITTRDERLLVEYGIDMVYEVKPLTQDEALFLFSRKAFKDDEGRDEWKSALDKLKQAPNRTIYETLKISYDGLDESEKRIFLDIACFHKFYYYEDNACFYTWYKKKQLVEVLDSCGFAGARIMVDVLIEKSLLSVSNKYVSMHDLIQEMAWEIVRQESNEEPGGRSRLWFRNDILHVLVENTGSEAIEGIVLRSSEFEEAHWNPEAFTKMCKLRLLHIHNVSLSKGPKYLPNALRVLKWSWYPSECLPPIFQPDELTRLSLQHSKIDRLWDGIKRLGKLKSIDLSYSHNLTRTPDFTGIQNLEELEMPSSVIRRSLEEIDLSGIALRETESSLVSVKNLVLSNFLGCNAPPARSWSSFFTSGEFPAKISHPASVVLASLKDLCFLKELNLKNCNLCEGAIPDDIGFLSSLRALNLSGNHFVSLPASISGLSKLGSFVLDNCKRLQQLPVIPLNSVLSIFTENCTSLKMLPCLPHACRLRYFCLRSVNCFSLAGNQGCNAIIYPMLKRFIQELPHFVKRFSIVIPGSEWFDNQSMGDSVIEKLPSHSCNSKVVGFASCALFVAAQNISAPNRALQCPGHDGHTIMCHHSLGSNNNFQSIGGFGPTQLNEVASDHLWLVFLSRKALLQSVTNRWEEKCWDQIRIHFGSETGLKVKKCGIRPLYEQDREEELNRRMKKYSNRSISLCEGITNCDFEESKTVQRDVIKRTREQYSNEAGPSEVEVPPKTKLKRHSLAKELLE
ncbi:hypothetical protein EV1_033737 [Malus domestica]